MSARHQYPCSFSGKIVTDIEKHRESLGMSKYEFMQYCVKEELRQHYVGESTTNPKKNNKSNSDHTGTNRPTEEGTDEGPRIIEDLDDE